VEILAPGSTLEPENIALRHQLCVLQLLCQETIEIALL
jgi:hypothetical protein